jgi:hypothetical protein
VLARLAGARHACHGDVLMVGITVKNMLKCCGFAQVLWQADSNGDGQH